ncbi:MAG: RtcB family protein [Candidatus Syntrophopropionicum ammoniitolerans]
MSGVQCNWNFGGGNHFIELQVISELYDRQTADAFGLCPGLT